MDLSAMILGQKNVLADFGLGKNAPDGPKDVDQQYFLNRNYGTFKIREEEKVRLIYYN